MFATQNSLFWPTGLLGLAIVGSLGDVIGVRTLFLLSGAEFLLVVLLWALAPSVRTMEGGPPGAEAPAAAC